MVSLNLTFLIEVSLFLLFLWGTARFILRPVLKGLDERESSIEHAREQTADDTNEAAMLEKGYIEKLSEIRGHADETYRKARHDTLKGHIQAVADAHEWADQAVAEVREEARGLVEGQRTAIRDSVPEIADLIAGRLRSGRTS